MVAVKKPKPVTIDFETEGIEGRPKYPPIPVGVSIKYPGKKAQYYAWGHPTKNNCKEAQAKKALVEAWKWGDGLLFQNGKFDVDVAETHMGLPRLKWDKYHDTLYLLFLDDPNQIQLGLKPSSERLLGMAPDEQDHVRDWLLANQPVEGVKISISKQSDHYFGRYICKAPGDLVGKYADGDVNRTEKLFDLLWAKTKKRGMLEAYDRERKLMLILLEIERQGVPVDVKKLGQDVKLYSAWMLTIEKWICKTLKVKHVSEVSDEKLALNIGSGAQLVEAMIQAKKANPDVMPLTPTGKYKTDKESLLLGVTDKTLLAVLKYRTQLKTCLNTFMKPWLLVAEQSGGLIYTTWNQTKSAEGAGAIGTRTGRLSSTPNFQNIPKEFGLIWHHEDPKAKLPKCPFKDLPRLPQVRSYVIPFAKDHVLLDRDYSQQEFRILAHFEGGVLTQAYIDNPQLDVHDYGKDMINKMTGKNFSRKPIKTTGFGLIYGMGLGKLAIGSDISVDLAKEVKTAYLDTFPGLKEMTKEMKRKAKDNEPLRTWGSREYYCEEPKFIQGRLRTFDYKMINALIQGSAADCTKEALIRYWEVKPASHKLLLTVHDEILISAPKKEAKKAMDILQGSMESIEFDVPMLSEGTWSDKSWADLNDFDKAGVLYYGK